MMLNMLETNELIELGCRTWWGEKKVSLPTEKTANREEFLPVEQNNPDRKAKVPPASVYFAIEMA